MVVGECVCTECSVVFEEVGLGLVNSFFFGVDEDDDKRGCR